MYFRETVVFLIIKKWFKLFYEVYLCSACFYFSDIYYFVTITTTYFLTVNASCKSIKVSFYNLKYQTYSVLQTYAISIDACDVRVVS